ncbi:MAG TPA: DUF1330 domain-containing protein [Bacteroidales bacterium]|nr:DUF1330 domain-containing protein [Bacteroidales bacterium]
MSYYFIANIRIHDREEYDKYLEKADEVFGNYNGEYLVADDHPEILEGTWGYTRTIIIEFKSKRDFEAWYNSLEYQEILQHRLHASHCDTILAKGFVR